MDDQTPDYVASDWDDAKLQALGMANSRGEEPVYSPERIEEIAAEVDILMVVYPDQAETLGLGVLIAKGESHLTEIVMDGKSRLLNTTAIHGADFLHAVAIRNRLAARHTHH